MKSRSLTTILGASFLISGIVVVLLAAAAMWAVPRSGSGAVMDAIAAIFGSGPSLNRIVVLTAGISLIASGVLLLGWVKSEILASVTIVLFTYLFMEATFTVLYLAHVVEPPSSIWAFENSGRTVHFDPVRGYTLTMTPSRFARVTHGTIEYVGVLKGNNQGLPDKDDFHPRRDNKAEKRFAVFGDSFTAGQYLEANWPDAAEGVARARNLPIKLLNFAVDGAGLANWWSVLTRIVEADRYEIDGVIFAVFPGDLQRKFVMSEHRGQSRNMFGRTPSWDPATYPATREAASAHLQVTGGHIVSTPTFEQLLEGQWTPPFRFSRDRARFYIAWKAQIAYAALAPKFGPQNVVAKFDEGQHKLIADMKRSVTALGVPVLVVHIPPKPELLKERFDALRFAEARAFTELLGGKFVDGKGAFAKSTPDDIKKMWLPYDGHWGQGGSDRFAEFMVDVLSTWP